VVVVINHEQEEPSAMNVSTVGRDLAKNVFQVHGIDDTGKVIVRRSLRRRQVIPFFSKLEPCLVGMEACGTSHFWARELSGLGHEVKLMPPKPMTSRAKKQGRFGKEDFRYLADDDVYVCPAGERLTYRYTRDQDGLRLRYYWTSACSTCAIKALCTPSKERRVNRWEHEDVVEAVQRRLDENPQAMRQRRETVEHPFGTIKARMGATHFLMKRLKNVRTEMALSVLAYNLTRVMNILGIRPLMAAIRA
jgi:hypothetical protein